DDDVGQHGHHSDRCDDHRTESTIDDQRVDSDEGKTDQAGDQTDLQLLSTQGCRDRVGALHVEAERQRAELQLVSESLRSLLRETSGDARATIKDLAVHSRSTNHAAIENKG